MIQYIPKDAVLAEIENLLDKGKYHDDYNCAYRDGNNCALYALKGRIDTLEVKEVDLDNAVEHFIEQHKSELRGGYFDIRRIARHFFELGLKKGE